MGMSGWTSLNMDSVLEAPVRRFWHSFADDNTFSKPSLCWILRGIGCSGSGSFGNVCHLLRVRIRTKSQARLQQVAMIARRSRHFGDGFARLVDLAFAQQQRWSHIGCPLGTGVQLNKVLRTLRVARLHEGPRARAERVVARIE